jgi:hypothetical protein
MGQIDNRTARKAADVTTIIVMVFVLLLFLTYFQTKSN